MYIDREETANECVLTVAARRLYEKTSEKRETNHRGFFFPVLSDQRS